MKPSEKDDLLKINLNHLERDAAEHARLVREWSSKLAKAEKDAKLAKRKVRMIKAELSKVIRQHPSKYGIFKVTDSTVEDVVVCITEYKEAEAAQIEKEYNRDIIKAMVISLHERGEQISNEVKLHGQGYWAKPRAEPDYIRGLQEETREDQMRKINKKSQE